MQISGNLGEALPISVTEITSHGSVNVNIQKARQHIESFCVNHCFVPALRLRNNLVCAVYVNISSGEILLSKNQTIFQNQVKSLLLEQSFFFDQ